MNRSGPPSSVSCLWSWMAQIFFDVLTVTKGVICKKCSFEAAHEIVRTLFVEVLSAPGLRLWSNTDLGPRLSTLRSSLNLHDITLMIQRLD